MNHNDKDKTTSQQPSCNNSDIVLDLPVHKHQVAGHLPLLYDNNSRTVCKPAHDAEVLFYANVNNIMPNITQFLPHVLGIVDCKGLVDLSSFTQEHISTDDDDAKDDEEETTEEAVYSHTWGKIVAQKKRSKLESNPDLRFICMEDLTGSFRRPCILDIKLGTQQHNPRESAKKIKSKMEKCATSTSSSLGLRLSGSQIYRRTGVDETYLCRDKYYGRKLNDEQLYDSLLEFFDNGDVNRSSDVIPLFLERLRRFKQVVMKPNPYRFYSSSLLFIYEGRRRSTHGDTSVSDISTDIDDDDDDINNNINSNNDDGDADDNLTRVDMRIIDFASVDIIREHSIDEGMLLGVNNLISFFEKILQLNNSIPVEKTTASTNKN